MVRPTKSTRVLWASSVIAAMAAMAGCGAPGDEDADTSEAASTEGFVPPAEPAASTYANPGLSRATFVNFDKAKIASADARRGLDTVFEGKGFRVAFPIAAAKTAERLAAAAGFVDRITGDRDRRIDPGTVDGRWTLSGKLPSPPGRPVPAGTALGTSVFERNGVPLSNNNCFTCHAGVVRGQVVAGLGNHDIDQTMSLHDLQKLVKIQPAIEADARVRTAFGPKYELEELSDFFANAKGTIVPTYKFAEARGDNMGPYAVWKRLSRLKDPSASGLQERSEGERSSLDDLFDSVDLAPVDPNPWWSRRYKSVNYAWGESSPGAAAHFAFNFTTPTAKVNEEHPAHVQAIADILEFAKNTSSPAYPERLDASMVKLGAEIFHGRTPIAAGKKLGCAGCHGTYTKKGTDYSKPSGWEVAYAETEVVDVGTDAAYSEIVRKLTPLATRGNGLREYFARQGRPEVAPQVIVPNRPGYVPPVLVGVWASAPYFHNGSVPTLYSVLKSSARPAVWSRPTDNAFAYSTVRVGMVFTELALGEREMEAKARAASSMDIASPEAVAFRAIYDTRKPGRSNAGHTFGDAMNEGERFAVIEFLKSLSGEDMPAK